MKRYTVIGVHDGGEENRFAESYMCAEPVDAECLALCDHPGLLIAGVVEGDCRLVDDDPACSGEDPAAERAAMLAGAGEILTLTDGAGI